MNDGERKETQVAKGILTVEVRRQKREIRLGIVDSDGKLLPIPKIAALEGKPATLKVRWMGPIPIIAGRGLIVFADGKISVVVPRDEKIRQINEFYTCPEDIPVMRGELVVIWCSERI
jgi:hypothetical protein